MPEFRSCLRDSQTGRKRGYGGVLFVLLAAVAGIGAPSDANAGCGDYVHWRGRPAQHESMTAADLQAILTPDVAIPFGRMTSEGDLRLSTSERAISQRVPLGNRLPGAVPGVPFRRPGCHGPSCRGGDAPLPVPAAPVLNLPQEQALPVAGMAPCEAALLLAAFSPETHLPEDLQVIRLFRPPRTASRG